MRYKIYDNSKNYTCQVIVLPQKQKVEGLDNLVKVTVQGNDCLIGKDSNQELLYLFFPSECQLSNDFVSANCLYRKAELNSNPELKGFFEENRRVKAVKFKGVVSSGFVIPITSLHFLGVNTDGLKPGDEFNEIDGIEICRKYIKKVYVKNGQKPPKSRIIDEIVDLRMAPEHFDTEHLLKNVHKLHFEDVIAVTYKIHGTSARYYNTLVKRKLGWFESILKRVGFKIQDEEYRYVTGSRKVVKSVDFEELEGKNHYYSNDLWSRVGEEYFKDKLNQGEAVYCEIIGKTYDGKAIQHGYTYGLDRPQVMIYRISNINPQGIEIDLPYKQMKERASELGLVCCPELYYGTVYEFLYNHLVDELTSFEEKFDTLLEKPSILDSSVVEEGFCVRVDSYPRPKIYKIKSKAFLLHEGVIKDKDLTDMEEQEVAGESV